MEEILRPLAKKQQGVSVDKINVRKEIAKIGKENLKTSIPGTKKGGGAPLPILAKANQGTRTDLTFGRILPKVSPMETRKEIAKIAKVSHDTIFYIRTSTSEQNPRNQLKDCESINSYGPYDLFEEHASAYKDKDRLEFTKIETLIKQGKVKHLICWDWDRLFRNRIKLKEFFQFCKMYGCQIHSVRQQFYEDLYKVPKPFDDIMQELTLNLMGWLAEDESKKKSDRVKIAFKNRTKQWGRKPLSENVKKEVLELRKAGHSMQEIAESVFYWDKNHNRKQISKSTVHKVINESTKGISTYHS